MVTLVSPRRCAADLDRVCLSPLRHPRRLSSALYPLPPARGRADELGCTPIGAGVGIALRVLAAAIKARSVVEVGTGAGVSGLYLLEGMGDEGVLTTIDIEAEHQRAAKEAFVEAGVRHQRTRLITGRALEVLPRLTDGAYDLVLIDADKPDLGSYLEEALRLLRPGGILAVDNALWAGKVADPAQRDEATTAIRELNRAVRADDSLLPALLPIGDGLLVAVKR
jgi:predicted O-methyltransferase YrrM